MSTTSQLPFRDEAKFFCSVLDKVTRHLDDVKSCVAVDPGVQEATIKNTPTFLLKHIMKYCKNKTAKKEGQQSQNQQQQSQNEDEEEKEADEDSYPLSEWTDECMELLMAFSTFQKFDKNRREYLERIGVSTLQFRRQIHRTGRESKAKWNRRLLQGKHKFNMMLLKKASERLNKLRKNPIPNLEEIRVATSQRVYLQSLVTLGRSTAQVSGRNFFYKKKSDFVTQAIIDAYFLRDPESSVSADQLFRKKCQLRRIILKIKKLEKPFKKNGKKKKNKMKKKKKKKKKKKEDEEEEELLEEEEEQDEQNENVTTPFNDANDNNQNSNNNNNNHPEQNKVPKSEEFKSLTEQRDELKKEINSCLLKPCEVIVFFGNWYVKPGQRFSFETSMFRKLIRAVKKRGFIVYVIDEHRSSKLCSRCMHVLHKALLRSDITKRWLKIHWRNKLFKDAEKPAEERIDNNNTENQNQTTFLFLDEDDENSNSSKNQVENEELQQLTQEQEQMFDALWLTVMEDDDDEEEEEEDDDEEEEEDDDDDEEEDYDSEDDESEDEAALHGQNNNNNQHNLQVVEGSAAKFKRTIEECIEEDRKNAFQPGSKGNQIFIDSQDSASSQQILGLHLQNQHQQQQNASNNNDEEEFSQDQQLRQQKTPKDQRTPKKKKRISEMRSHRNQKFTDVPTTTGGTLDEFRNVKLRWTHKVLICPHCTFCSQQSDKTIKEGFKCVYYNRDPNACNNITKYGIACMKQLEDNSWENDTLPLQVPMHLFEEKLGRNSALAFTPPRNPHVDVGEYLKEFPRRVVSNKKTSTTTTTTTSAATAAAGGNGVPSTSSLAPQSLRLNEKFTWWADNFLEYLEKCQETEELSRKGLEEAWNALLQEHNCSNNVDPEKDETFPDCTRHVKATFLKGAQVSNALVRVLEKRQKVKKGKKEKKKKEKNESENDNEDENEEDYANYQKKKRSEK